MGKPLFTIYIFLASGAAAIAAAKAADPPPRVVSVLACAFCNERVEERTDNN